MSTLTYVLFAVILVYRLLPLNWRNKKRLIKRRKRFTLKGVHEAHYLRMQIMTLKAMTQGTF